MSYADRLAYLEALEEKARRVSLQKIRTYYPETGPLRRELYPKHMAFFAAGTHYRERLMLAANRVGKTEGVGVYELVLHLTGDYPAWWNGRRFDRPVNAWAAGDTGKTVRDILQHKLLGKWGEFGTGVLPGASLIGTTEECPLETYHVVTTDSFCSERDSSSRERSGDTRVPYCSCARNAENRSLSPAAATTTRARNGTNRTRRSFARKLSFLNTLG